MYQWNANARISTLRMGGINLNLCILRMLEDAFFPWRGDPYYGNQAKSVDIQYTQHIFSLILPF